MKLVLAVVEDDDAIILMDALVENEFGETKLASTGGFLQRGNTKLLIGVVADRVVVTIALIRRFCCRKKRVLPQAVAEVPPSISLPIEVESGGATIFVLSVDRFQKV